MIWLDALGKQIALDRRWMRDVRRRPRILTRSVGTQGLRSEGPGTVLQNLGTRNVLPRRYLAQTIGEGMPTQRLETRARYARNLARK